jgi:hypothetical protein
LKHIGKGPAGVVGSHVTNSPSVWECIEPLDGWKIVIVWQRVVAWTALGIDNDRVIGARRCVQSTKYQLFSMFQGSTFGSTHALYRGSHEFCIG